MNERFVYLGAAPNRFLSVYQPPDEPRGRPAVVLVPPFGWEEIASHRAVRDWAAHLAAHGYPVLRLDLPGTGDSAGGPTDPGTLTAWHAAVGQAADWVRTEAAAVTVAGIGIGVGGLLVYEAAARGELDHVVLWATPSRGRTLVRELSAFASLETARIVESGSPEPPPLPEHMLAPGGFVLSPADRRRPLGREPRDASARGGDARPPPRPRRDQTRRRSAGRRDGRGSRPDGRERQGLLGDACRAGQVT